MTIGKKPFILSLLFMFFLAACAPPDATPVQQGAINLQVSGLPQGTAADITVSGPAGFSQTVTGSTMIPNLPPGNYTVTARPVTANGATYQPSPVQQNVDITADLTSTVTVIYNPPGADPTPPGPTPPGASLVNLTFTEAVPDTLANTGFTLTQGGEAFFNPNNLDLSTGAGTLTIDAQPGLQFQAANTLENGLGVMVDATTQARMLETTFTKPAFPGVNNQNANQQAGLWYGQPGNQDDYVKLVVISMAGDATTSAIELRREINGQTVETPEGLRRTAPFTIPTGATITLRLVVQPNGTAVGYYSVAGQPFQQVTTGGVQIPGLVTTQSAGGIMASRRNDPTGPLPVVFDSFSVSEATAQPTPPAPTPPAPTPPAPTPPAPTPPEPTPPTPITGSLRINVSGLPNGEAASITVTGSNSLIQISTNTTTTLNLTPGSYSLVAADVEANGVTYRANNPSRNRNIVAGQTANANFVYAPVDNGDGENGNGEGENGNGEDDGEDDNGNGEDDGEDDNGNGENGEDGNGEDGNGGGENGDSDGENGGGEDEDNSNGENGNGENGESGSGNGG